MNRKASLFAGWRHRFAFWAGSAMVAAGVALHLPMFWMGRNMGFRLVGMPMDPGMLVGMALIVIGVLAAAYGLLPARLPDHISRGSITPPEDVPLTKAHWIQIALVGVALVVDVMKAATLGFVTPGMRTEYGLGSDQIAVLAAGRVDRNYGGIVSYGAPSPTSMAGEPRFCLRQSCSWALPFAEPCRRSRGIFSCAS